MGHISIFDFHAGNSILHRLDIRMKLVIMIAMNLAVANTGIEGMLALSAVMVLLLVYLHLSILKLLSEVRLFLFLLLFVFLARSISEPGKALFDIWSISVTLAGIQSGGVICWRLMLVVFIGLFFIRTSKPSEIKSAVQWFLGPVPGVPANRIALMISLMFRFIPMILDLYAEISDAQQSRAVALRKNPLFRMKMLVIPLMENIFRKADEMALAMEARCYSDNRTDPSLTAGKEDWLVGLFAGVGVSMLLVI